MRQVAFIPALLNLRRYEGPSIKRRPGSVTQPQVGATNRRVPAFSLSKPPYPFCLMANHYYSSSQLHRFAGGAGAYSTGQEDGTDLGQSKQYTYVYKNQLLIK